jgi:hypothetical protein
MKSRYILALVFLIICSCTKKDKIEIFLLKERKQNLDGIQLSKAKHFISKDTVHLKYMTAMTTYDTVRQKIFYASNFKFEASDLQSTPFITNDQILLLDIKKNLLVLDNEAGWKLLKFKPSMNNGEQFVITINGRPELNGYLWNYRSPQGSSWNTIQYDDFKTIQDSTLKTYSFSFFKGDGTSSRATRKSVDFKKHESFLVAFREQGKLAE